MNDALKWVDLAGHALPLVMCFAILGIVLHHTYWHPELALSKEVLGLAGLAAGFLWGKSSAQPAKVG